MEGVLVSYRRGRHTQYERQGLIKVPGIDNKEEAKKLVGKTVVLEFKSSKIYGKISSLHGNKGVVRAIFRRGIPGQAIGMKVKILGV